MKRIDEIRERCNAATEDIPYLLDEIEKLERENALMKDMYAAVSKDKVESDAQLAASQRREQAAVENMVAPLVECPKCGWCHRTMSELDTLFAINNKCGPQEGGIAMKMNIRRAYDIFRNINSDRYSDEEKGTAIYHIMTLPTHMGVTKDVMVEVIRYLWGLNFRWPQEKGE